MQVDFSISKKKKILNENTLLAPVDLAKKSNVSYWEAPNGFEGRPFRFNNNLEGFSRFWNTIEAVMAKYQLERVVVAFRVPFGCYGVLWRTIATFPERQAWRYLGAGKS